MSPSLALVADAADPARQHREPPQDEQHDHGNAQDQGILAAAQPHAQRGDQPDRRGGGQADHPSAIAQNDPGPQKADAADDIRADAGRVIAASQLSRQQGEQRRTDTDEDQRTDARGLGAKLALEADHAADADGQQDFHEIIRQGHRGPSVSFYEQTPVSLGSLEYPTRDLIVGGIFLPGLAARAVVTAFASAP